MTTFDDVLMLPVVQRLGWVLLHFLWQGVFIGILCGVLLRLPPAKKPRAAYGVCLGGLFLCALFPVATFYAVEPVDVPPVLLSGSAVPSADAAATAAAPKAPVFVPEAKDLKAGFADMRYVPEKETPPPWHERVLTALAPYVPWIVVVWLPVAFLLSLRLGWQWGQTRLWVRAGKIMNEAATQTRLSQLCARIGVRGKVVLRESARVLGPLTVGFFKPAILLPVGFMAGVTPAHLEAILLHELAHIRRWDYAVNLLVAALTALLFYHPVVWWLDRRARLARELCCDALAAERYGDACAYAQALAQLETRLRGGHAVAPAAGDGPLVQRIRALAGQRGMPGLSGRSLANLTAIFALTLSGALLLQFASAANAQNVSDSLQKPAPSGQVIGTDGDPVAGAQVALYHRKDWRGLENGVVETTRTDTRGRFAFTHALDYVKVPGDISEDTYYVVAWAPEQALALFILDRNAKKTDDLALRLGKPEPRRISVADKDGNPVEGATAHIQWIAQKRVGTAYFKPAFGPLETKTDAQGVAVFTQLPEGDVAVGVSKEGFAPNWTGCGSSGKKDFSVRLSPAALLRGRVITREGAPLSGILVYAEPRWPLMDYTATRTDAEGNFTLNGLYGKGDAWDPTGGDGCYRLAIESPDYCAPAVDVALKSGQAKSVGELTAWSGARIRGVLLDSSSQKPLPGMDLLVSTQGGQSNVLTDAQGRFQFLAPDGLFDVMVSQPPRGYYLMDDGQGSPLFTGEAAGKPQELTLRAPAPLGRLGVVRGRVLTPEGTPAVDASVVIGLRAPAYLKAERMGGDTFGPAKTNALGVYEFPKYPKGLPLDIVAFCANDAVTTQANPVPIETDSLPDIVLKKGWSPRVCVTDAEGRPLAGQKITYGIQLKGDLKASNGIPPVSSHLTREAKTDDQGIAVFEGIPEGAVCDFWRKGKPITWKRVSPDMLKAGKTPSFVLSEKLRVQCLDSNGDPIQIKRLQNNPSAFDELTQEAAEDLAISRAGIDKNAVADGWVDADKRSLAFKSPGSRVRLWAQRADGFHVQVEGVMPTQDNILVAKVLPAAYAAGRVPNPPRPLADDEAAYRVIDENGNPLSGVRAASVRNFGNDASVEAITDEQGWCFLKGFAKRSSPLALEFSRPDYAPTWTENVSERSVHAVVLTKNTRIQGRLSGPSGESVGKVSLRFFKETEPRRGGLDGLPAVASGLDYRVNTDDQGRYDILIEPGRYCVQGESERGFFLDEKVFEIGLNQTRTLAKRMQPGATLTLVCTDIATGRPAEGLRAQIYESKGFALIDSREDSLRTADAAGRMTWESLPPWSVCFVLARGQNPYARWWSECDALRQPIPRPYAENLPQLSAGCGSLVFELKSGVQEIPVVAERGIMVSGKILLPENRPDINRLWLDIMPVGRRNESGFFWIMPMGIGVNLKTGEFSGWFPAGNGVDYRLQARAFGPAQKPGVHPSLPAAVSEVFSSKAGDCFQFELSMLGGGYLRGRAVDAQGNSLGKLEIYYAMADSVATRLGGSVIISDEKGCFSIGPIRAGEYDLNGFQKRFAPRRASAPEPGPAKRAIVREGETTELGDIVFAQGMPQTP